MVCRWCRKELKGSRRRDARFCDVKCRQAHHRFTRGRGVFTSLGDPIRVAYADPPYPGRSRLYKGRSDYGGEVDFRALVLRLQLEYPHGWALSTSSAGLAEVLRYCPPGVRIGAWFRGERPCKSSLPLVAWEPVVCFGGRVYPSTVDRRRVDALVHVHRPRRADPGQVIGSKPAAFCWWLFDLLGLRPGDELADLFPGSGRVSYAFEEFGGKVFVPGPGDASSTVG